MRMLSEKEAIAKARSYLKQHHSGVYIHIRPGDPTDETRVVNIDGELDANGIASVLLLLHTGEGYPVP